MKAKRIFSTCFRGVTLPLLTILMLFYQHAFAQKVLNTSPAQNAINVNRSTTIKVKFDSLMDGSSFSNSTFVVNGLRMGLITGSLNYTDTDTSVTFTSARDFCAGEIVTVVLTKDIKTLNSTQPDTAFTFSFITASNDGSGSFFSKTDYETGSNPHTVFSADFDGDYDIDLVVTNYGENTVSVFLNKGDGTFSSKTDYETGSNGPRSVFSADFDSDSDLDLVVTNYYFGNTVSILLNDGYGTFSNRVDYVTGDNPWSVFSVDFDGDGDFDLAVSNEGSNTVSILLNNGNGIFTGKTDYETGSYPGSVFSADLDSDGDLDLALVNGSSYTVSIFLNNGDGTFVAKTDYSIGSSPQSVFSTDFNGDGDMDLAVTNDAGTVSILLNNGDGTFSTKTDYIAGGSPHYSVFSTDYDGDGDLDLAVANFNSNNVSILLNNGDGTFATKTDHGTGSNPYSVFSADFDGDGDLDIAFSNTGSNTISIRLNRNSAQDIKFSSDSYNFGSVAKDASKTWDLKIYNTGISGNLEISNIIPGSPYFTVDKTIGTIKPDSSLTVQVTFTPTSLGNYLDSLAISSNDPYNPIVYVYLSGVCGTYVSGAITEDSTWTKVNSPYVVNGQLTINPGVTLTIESGVEVKFDGSYSFTVDGNLLINGTFEENVVFTSVYGSDPGNWNKLHFTSTGSGNLNYLKLQSATDGISAENANSLKIHNSLVEKNSNYGIKLNSTSAIISNTIIKNNGTGINAVSSSPEIDSCTISENTSYGLFFTGNNGSAYITNSFISDNKGFGVYYSDGNDNGKIEIKDNEIIRNTNWGVYMEGASCSSAVKFNTIKNNGGGICSHTNTLIGNNVISENNGDGINATNSIITIKSNRIKDNTGDGIETTSNITIYQNDISGNNGDGIKALSAPFITYNEINNNGDDGIETSGLPVINYNNFSDNTGYDLKATKQGTQTINAENNYWNTTEENTIKIRIWDYNDDGSIVKVDYSPYYNDKVELLPVSGFTGQTLAGGKIKLSWNPHILASQYLLYHDNQTGTIDTTTAWVTLDSANMEYSATFSDGEYKFGIKILDKDGRKSPLDSCYAIADGISPTLLSSTGFIGDSIITVTFSENTDYISAENIDNWTLSGGLTISSIKAGDYWMKKNDMPIAKQYVSGGVIDNNFYCIGGHDGGTSLSSVEQYNPMTNTWTTKAEMPTARDQLAVGAINGKLYAIGGHVGISTLSIVEEYDPISDTWTTKASMPTPRNFLAIGIINNMLYAVGGNNNYNPISTVEIYDPINNIWVSKTPMPTMSGGVTAGVVKDKLYVLSGGNLDVYDPLTDTWSTKAGKPILSESLGVGVIRDKLYVVGGIGNQCLIEEYNPETDAWTYKADMPTARWGFAIGVINNKMYVAGGRDNYIDHLSIVEEYTPFGKEVILYLNEGQVLPSPITQITVTCSNIKDIYGNTGGSQTDTLAEQLNITSVYSEIICPGDTNGYIDISVSGGTPPYSYSWSNDSTTQDINNLIAGSYSVTVMDAVNQFESEGFYISQAVPYNNEEICIVTVNETNKNIVVWEKTPDKGIDSYNIYRETIDVGEYELIGTIPYENLSVFTDTTSNANQRSYQYKLAITDTCGNESEKSLYHRTMLLQVGVGIGAYNLEWDDYEYEGGGFTFSKFYIYRGPSEDDLQIIDSIGANYFTYIDDNPPEGLLYYQVAGVKPDGCSPTGTKKIVSGENYTLSYTNIEDNGVTGPGDIHFTDKIRIYPNPFSDKTIIEFPNSNSGSYKLIITNVSGETVRIIENIKTNKVEFEKGTLPEGLYLIELIGNNVYRGKIVID